MNMLTKMPVSSVEHYTALKLASNSEIREAIETMRSDSIQDIRRLAACKRELRRRGR